MPSVYRPRRPWTTAIYQAVDRHFEAFATVYDDTPAPLTSTDPATQWSVQQGFVDIRLTMLLYLGSLLGIFIAAYGVKVVKELMIRLVTGAIIMLCVISRAIAVPMYLRQLGWLRMNADWDVYFNQASKAMLFLAGVSGVVVILYNVIAAYRQRRRIETTLIAPRNLGQAA